MPAAIDAQVVQPQVRSRRGELSAKQTDDKGFGERAEQRALTNDRVGADAEKNNGECCVDQMSLRCAVESFQAVGPPSGRPIDREQVCQELLVCNQRLAVYAGVLVDSLLPHNLRRDGRERLKELVHLGWVAVFLDQLDITRDQLVDVAPEPLLPGILGGALGWRKPRTVFVNSMSDLLHVDVPVDFIGRVFDVMAATPRHTYPVLTKRSKRLRDLAGILDWPSNLWMGVNIENDWHMFRADHLASCRRPSGFSRSSRFSALVRRWICPASSG